MTCIFNIAEQNTYFIFQELYMNLQNIKKAHRS